MVEFLDGIVENVDVSSHSVCGEERHTETVFFFHLFPRGTIRRFRCVGPSGYDIYRAVHLNSCESFSKINSVLNTGTLYTDEVVADGTSYCYATTAVNSSDEESGYSNIVSNIQIPAP
jgi:hypothetical protein